MKCKNCNAETSNSRFCSIKCQHDFEFKTKVNEIDSAGVFPVAFNNEVNRRFVRRYLEYKYGHKCSICGIDKWNNQDIVLIVDHIDGDSTNLKISNYRLVCPNCDSQLPTFKRKNKNCKRNRIGQPRTTNNWQGKGYVFFHKGTLKRRFDPANESRLLQDGWIRGYK